jgi:hypothetical protein
MGKGDKRRVENTQAIRDQYDKLDWENDKKPRPRKPKLDHYHFPDIPHLGVLGNLPHVCHICDTTRVLEDGSPCPCTTL